MFLFHLSHFTFPHTALQNGVLSIVKRFEEALIYKRYLLWAYLYASIMVSWWFQLIITNYKNKRAWIVLFNL